MSQAGTLGVNGTPTIATTFVTDDGNAIPALNILNILAVDTAENNDNGIRTAGAGNTVTIELTNRIQGTATTSGAVTADLVTLDLGATPGCSTYEVTVSAFESTGDSGGSYRLFFGVKTDGATATIIDNDVDKIVHEDAALSAGNVTAVTSGNDLIIRSTGTAGLNVDWSAVGYYALAT